MTDNLCPMCGQPLKRRGRISRAFSAYRGWRQSRMVTFQNTSLTPWQPPAPTGGNEPGRYLEAERRFPFRPQNAESDFLVPLLQALGTGVFVTIVAGWGAWLYRGFTWYDALGCGLVAAGGFWVITVIANRSLLWQVERIINSDLDNDGAIGQPPPAQSVALEVTHRSQDDNFRRMFRFELPAGISEADFVDFANGVTIERRGLAESAWTGAGKPFSKPKYTELLTTLDRAGLVRWRNSQAPAQGRELTPAGGRALRGYLEVARRGQQTARAHTQPSNGGAGYVFIEGAG